ncbi:hypothetical protein ACF0H5_009517 [Mactra antiquata]
MNGYIVCNILVLFLCINGLESHPTGYADEDNKNLTGDGPRKYNKRSVYSVLPSTVSWQHLVNATTMVCTEALTIPSSRMVELNDEQMRAILQNRGGNYVQDYMAATQEEADENFPNMLILMPATTIPGSTSSFSMLDNLITKNMVVADLQKLSAYWASNLTQTFKTPSAPFGQTPTPFHNNGNSNSQQTPTMTFSTQDYQHTSPTTFTPMTNKLSNNSSKAGNPVSGEYGKDGTSTVPGMDLDSDKSTTITQQPELKSDGYTTTLDPEVLKGIDELNKYVHGLTKRDLDDVWRHAGTKLHPAMLLDLSHGHTRRKRNTDGSTTREEYCQPKGKLTEDGKFKHLCSMCASTTTLSPDIFPRYINEVVCKTGDTDCFTVGGTAHGQCKQTRFNLNMLQKRRGFCKMFLHGGETLVFEDWVLAPHRIRVSCECTINRLSMFSQYIAQSVPMG